MSESMLGVLSYTAYDSYITFVHIGIQCPRLFAYCRVSITDQITENQVQEIAAAGFAIAKQRIVAETVSGSVAALERKGLAKLLDKLEAGDVLVVTKLDRLGHNAMERTATVERLEASGLRFIVLPWATLT